jgi:hypothetical protein
MRIEILYVPGCPNYQPTFERLQAVLASEAVKAEVQGIPVTTEVEAKALLFSGSPTVRVNGEDVEPQQTSEPSLACRLYENRSGIPSEELLRVATSGRSGGSENSHASGRTSNACGSSDRCAIDSSLLLAIYLSGSAWFGGSKRAVAVITPLVARECSHLARHRLHSVVRSAQSMPKAKPVQHRPVLGRCFDRPSCDSFPSSDSQFDCRVRHANAKTQIRVLAGRDRRCAVDRLVFLVVEGNATRSTRAHITDTK